ncbi:Polyadenylate-binding protein [Tritrichomonas foetus]|uniref:Polyadenylate-binding protein n=1 Tax=Tritrichomonas foetus TaxID=1144522 RepID=A0A1J4KCW7_9EUKA|nr:Polyadenylate-binding protein [Tritrichomonas foetus]|eukprot:OHT09271.1 Polyadenylate-binding protein [Tritrichomonas foetus]
MTEQKEVSTVYVGDLPNQVGDDFVLDFFGGVGKIVSHKIQISNRPGKHSAFAFIVYSTREEAERAVNELNYTKLNGIPIRMNIADPEYEKIRNSGRGNIIIRNLDSSIGVEDLHQAFSTFGEIISCRIQSVKGKSINYGYVQFKNPADADEAIREMEGASINDRKVVIELFKPVDNFYNIWIKTLPPSITTSQELVEWFSKFGEAQKAILVKFPDRPDQNQGVITLADPEVTRTIFDEMNGAKIDGVTITCDRISNKDKFAMLSENKARWDNFKYENVKGRNLYVKNIPADITHDELQTEFGQFGEIDSVHIKKQGVYPYAFITFSTEEGAATAIERSTFMQIDGKQVYVGVYYKKQDLLKMKFNRDEIRNAKSELLKRVELSVGQKSPLFVRAKDLSDDQIKVLYTNLDVYDEWINQNEA